MGRTQIYSKGFSAPELLITLFIGSIFLIGGFQVWVQVTQTGSEANKQAIASNTAYQYARKHSVATANPCVASTPVNNQVITVDELSGPRITVTITCPYSSVPPMVNISKTTVTLTHGPTAERKTVTHALFN
jgi:prepilin-type N-terminal cleavage/methylation domain-containing protein